MASYAARLTTPVISAVIPPARTATPTPVTARNRRATPRIPSAETTSARNDRARPMAARSCMAGETGMGTSPTIVMCAPADTIEVRMPREAHTPTDSGRSARSSIPYIASSIPAPITVVLNRRPEKSAWVPSSEKCSRHQNGSLVVSTATRTPKARLLMASVNERCESGRRVRVARFRGTSTARRAMAGETWVLIVDVVIVVPRGRRLAPHETVRHGIPKRASSTPAGSPLADGSVTALVPGASYPRRATRAICRLSGSADILDRRLRTPRRADAETCESRGPMVSADRRA